MGIRIRSSGRMKWSAPRRPSRRRRRGTAVCARRGPRPRCRRRSSETVPPLPRPPPSWANSMRTWCSPEGGGQRPVGLDLGDLQGAEVVRGLRPAVPGVQAPAAEAAAPGEDDALDRAVGGGDLGGDGERLVLDVDQAVSGWTGGKEVSGSLASYVIGPRRCTSGIGGIWRWISGMSRAFLPARPGRATLSLLSQCAAVRPGASPVPGERLDALRLSG